MRLNDGVHLIVSHDIDQAIRDAAEVYARAMPIFVFARGQDVSDFEVSRHQIHNVLLSSGCFLNAGEIDSLADKWQQEWSFRKDLEKLGNQSIGF